ncbi:hypothetical protein [Spirulina subsalsa]|uniref:hypothetical protein n=1 Tax=Spirulina subsalsa TaxID=54311 RepID=UPI00192AC43C|nr:hypothetical protein [Spirulina subsalsa]
MAILSLSFRKALGSTKASDVEPNCLERSLRLAYEVAYFRQTQLYILLCQWEENQQNYSLFQAELKRMC